MVGSGTERRDGGFTLLEVMVAFALFAVMSTALLVVVSASQRLTQEDTVRVVAQNLASRELEITRDTFSGTTRGPARVSTNQVENPNPLPGGTAGAPLVVDGVPYTVVREARWAAVGEAGSKCDDGSSAELAYLKVRVEVSWPRLGSRPPVRMDTVITPPKGTYRTGTGLIGLKVLDRDGQPRSGVRVTATKSGPVREATTSADGCVLFDGLDPGSYTVTLATPGQVGPSGAPTVTRTVPVQAGQLWRGTQEYDEAASIVATLAAAEGFSLPQGIDQVPLSLGNSALLPRGQRAVSGTGPVRRLDNLWPYPSGYQLWAGACGDSDPGDAKGAPIDATPGATTTADLLLPSVEVSVSSSDRVVTARHEADSTCADPVTLTLGKAVGQTLRTSLPYGTWKLSRTGSDQQTPVTIAAPASGAGTPAVTQVQIP